MSSDTLLQLKFDSQCAILASYNIVVELGKELVLNIMGAL